MSATDTLITLTGGFVIRSSVAAWLSKASFRLTFSVVDSELKVFPRSAVTAEDDRYIRSHSDELIAAVSYDERTEAQL